MPNNPYITSGPVGKTHAFVGRINTLQRGLNTLRNSQSKPLLFYGQPQIGKTSLLQRLHGFLKQKGLKQPQDCFVVSMNLNNQKNKSLDDILYDLAKKIATEIDYICLDINSNITVKFQEEWLPEAIKMMPEGRHLIIIFDDIDLIDEPNTRPTDRGSLFTYLNTLIPLYPKTLKFIFAISKSISCLSPNALALFKTMNSHRIGLLPKNDALQLIRLSENRGLHWEEEAIERIWILTNGHALLIQQLCSHLWEEAYRFPATIQTPTVSLSNVNDSIPEILESLITTFTWLWDGFSSSEQLVMSVLARVEFRCIQEHELVRLLHESGIRIVLGEFLHVPLRMQELDILEETANGYQFRIELFRRWIAKYKPIGLVLVALDKLDPIAEQLFRTAQAFYTARDLPATIATLQKALQQNPKHIQARSFLADIYIKQQELYLARKELKILFEIVPIEAQARLTDVLQALFRQAKKISEKEQFFNELLQIDLEFNHNLQAYGEMLHMEINQRQRKIYGIFFLILTLCGLPLGAYFLAKNLQTHHSIQIVGSSTVEPITTLMQKRFQSVLNPTYYAYLNGQITVDVTGTTGGFDVLCDKDIPIHLVNASVEIKPDANTEKLRSIYSKTAQRCDENGYGKLIAFHISNDRLPILVNRQNHLVEQKNFSLKEIRDLFITHTLWSDVDQSWRREPIARFIPDEKSGTYEFFAAKVLDGNTELEEKLMRLNLKRSSSDSVLTFGMRNSPNALGFLGYAHYYKQQESLLALRVEDLLPEEEGYIFQRPLFLYTTDLLIQMNPYLQEFLRFYFSHVNAIATQVHYFPIDSEVLSDNLVRLDAIVHNSPLPEVTAQ